MKKGYVYFARFAGILAGIFALFFFGQLTGMGKIVFVENISGKFERLEEKKGTLNRMPVKIFTGHHSGEPLQAIEDFIPEGFKGGGKNSAVGLRIDFKRLFDGRRFDIESGFAFKRDSGGSDVFKIVLENITLEELASMLYSFPPEENLPACRGGYGFSLVLENSTAYLSAHEVKRDELISSMKDILSERDYMEISPGFYISKDRRCVFAIVEKDEGSTCISLCQ